MNNPYQTPVTESSGDSRKRSRLFAVVVGVLIVTVSLFFIVGGLCFIVIGFGLSPAAKNWSANFGAFIGTVMSLIGLLGFIIGGALLRWGRR